MEAGDLLIYPSLIQCPLVSSCISCMFGMSDSKIVSAREVIFCTHKQVVVFCWIQYSINPFYRWYPDWSGWQTVVLVCVVRRFHFKMFEQDSAQCGIAHGIFYCGVCFEAHAFF